LADISNINENLFFRYPASKVILIDAGLKQNDIIAILLSYRIYGVISAHTDFRLFKKALQVVSDGQIWIDNDLVRTFLHNEGLISKTGRVNGVTGREREIVEFVCQGHSNKEIATKLSLSEHTVKAHLNRIFRKFSVSNRSQLIALSINNHLVLKQD
jgi:DNA-binding NarL/FixJ family response regulator